MEEISIPSKNNFSNTNKWRLSVAPMLDWTDTHYRYLARKITQKTRLYTEMIHMGAIVYGERSYFLRHQEEEYPLALQVGGSDRVQLQQCAIIAEEYGFDEINLNCGCPSERVQRGAFGACLMKEVDLVSDCLKSMKEVANIDVTIKHRIGIDKEEDYSFVSDFVGEVNRKSECQVFIVHARNAWLKGLSPKENREIPPLKYNFVYRLKTEFPDLIFVLNGGIRSNFEIENHLKYVDGVMVGREAYHNPMIMEEWDQLFFQHAHKVSYEQLIEYLFIYAKNKIEENKEIKLRNIVRHYLGLMHGKPRARMWRQILSDSILLEKNDPDLILHAWEKMSILTR